MCAKLIGNELAPLINSIKLLKLARRLRKRLDSGKQIPLASPGVYCGALAVTSAQ